MCLSISKYYTKRDLGHTIIHEEVTTTKIPGETKNYQKREIPIVLNCKHILHIIFLSEIPL